MAQETRDHGPRTPTHALRQEGSRDEGGQGMKPLLLAIVLVLVPVAASAECAWVLWSNLISSNPASRYAPSTGGLWTPESAGTRTKCEKARDRMQTGSVVAEAMGPGTQPLPHGRAEAAGVVGPNGQTLFTRLPDTVDPRGPKGKSS